jgi:ribonuclease J
MTSITVFDGAESIGGNKIHVEEAGRGVFLDFGTNFGKTAMFFSDFLQNRTSRGINDALALGIIPELDIYRSDLRPSDVKTAGYPHLNVEAVLLSHAHVDHCGAIGYLDENIPIVTSATSIAILKGMQDTTLTSTDVVYLRKKVPSDEKGLRVMSGSEEMIGRNFSATTKPSAKLEEFLADKPKGPKSKKTMTPGLLSHYEELDLPFEVHAYDMDHSIYGACAYLLKGDTTIAYTGDFRLHGKYGNTSKKFVNAAKSASVLIIEGTRVERSGESKDDDTVSEDSVREICRSSVESAGNDLVIADFGPRNFERLETFQAIAKKTGRQLVVTAKDAYMFLALDCADHACSMKDVRIYDELKDRRNIKWETEVVMQQFGNKYLSCDKIHAAPEKYILCFSTYDLKHLLDIKPDQGTYIYSACESFSESMDLDFKMLWNWLDYFKFDVKGFSVSEENEKEIVSFDKEYHASGHASQKDLAWTIDTINPEVIIPVHTENPAWFADKWENTRVVHDGERVEF